MNVSFLQELLNTVAEQSRALLPKALFGAGGEENVEALARALMSGRGEASGVAIARQLLTCLKTASPDDRRKFFAFLADELQPDAAGVSRAAEAYLAHPNEASLSALQKASESPRREFFRRLNLAPGATAEIVSSIAACGSPTATKSPYEVRLRARGEWWTCLSSLTCQGHLAPTGLPSGTPPANS